MNRSDEIHAQQATLRHGRSFELAAIFEKEEPLMKTVALGFAAAVALGLASFAVPASAATSQSAGISAPMTDVSSQVVVRRTVVRGGPVCSVRKVVRRGPMGRRVVSTTRVCR